MSDSLWPHLQHAKLPCPSPSPGVCSNSRPLSWWCHPTISSSVVPFFSCLQTSPASGSFLMSQLLALGGHSIGASASVLLVTIQDWFPLGWTGLILQSRELSKVFSNTTVQKHQPFSTQPSYGPRSSREEFSLRTAANWDDVGHSIVLRLLSCVWLFGTPWTAARQAPLPSTISQSLLRFMFIDAVMLSNYLTV